MFGYPNELGQAILNIINNAKDALIEKNVEDKTISVSLSQNENHPTLTISDNAGGIPAGIIDKIFDPYFSTKEKSGTGLGLYMTKLIIEDHMKGKINVTNNMEGAVFTLIF
jgi:signal transduction histidine kinase